MTDGRYGVFFQQADAQGRALTIRLLYATPEESQQLGEVGAFEVEVRHNVGKITENVERMRLTFPRASARTLIEWLETVA